MSVEIDLSLPVRSGFCAVTRRNDSLGPRARWTLFHRGESLPLGEGLPAHERATIARELRRALAVGNAR